MDHPLELRIRGRHVVLRVVIRRKDVSNLDGMGGGRSRIELKSIVSGISGRRVSEFGTVRPWVQIRGPRPTPYAGVERKALTFVVCGSSSSCVYRDDSTSISAMFPAYL